MLFDCNKQVLSVATKFIRMEVKNALRLELHQHTFKELFFTFNRAQTVLTFSVTLTFGASGAAFVDLVIQHVTLVIITHNHRSKTTFLDGTANGFTFSPGHLKW